MDFLIAGIDARRWPNPDWISADTSEWEVDEYYSEVLAKKFNLTKNCFQLLQVDDEQLFCEIINFVRINGNFNLVILCVQESIVKYGYKGLSIDRHLVDLKSIPENLVFRGYDVCDLDGFFTILNCDTVLRSESINKLIQSRSFAFEIAHDASLFEKKHAPYSVVKVLSVF